MSLSWHQGNQGKAYTLNVYRIRHPQYEIPAILNKEQTELNTPFLCYAGWLQSMQGQGQLQLQNKTQLWHPWTCTINTRLPKQLCLSTLVYCMDHWNHTANMVLPCAWSANSNWREFIVLHTTKVHSEKINTCVNNNQSITMKVIVPFFIQQNGQMSEQQSASWLDCVLKSESIMNTYQDDI